MRDWLFVVDPLAHLKPAKDSSIAIMRAAQAAGHAVWACEVGHLFADIRALELLGKISDVGLFTERTEITVTHQSTDDLRTKLREKFNRLKEVEDAKVVSPLELELDAELGLND